MPQTAQDAIHCPFGTLTGAHPMLHWDLHERRRQIAVECSTRAMSGISVYSSHMAAAGNYSTSYTEPSTGSALRRRRIRWMKWGADPNKIRVKKRKRPGLNNSGIFEFTKFSKNWNKSGSTAAHDARAALMEEEDFWDADFWDDDYWDNYFVRGEEEEASTMVTDEGSWTAASAGDGDDLDWETVTALDPDADSAAATSSPSSEDWEVVENAVPSFADVLRRRPKCLSDAPRDAATANTRAGEAEPNIVKVRKGHPDEGEEEDFLLGVYDGSKMQRGGKAKHHFKRERKK